VSPENSAHTDSTKRQQFRDSCGKCGARRVDQQVGLESTPDEYVARLVEVFREVRRVLRDDGTVWLNLGDTYNAYNGNRGESVSLDRTRDRVGARPKLSTGAGLTAKGAKPKDLLGIPWMVAFALRADGWYLRSDIVWAKPNPMPESVTDRPTRSHEYVFLLSKSARYFYDADAIREPAAEATGPRHQRGRSEGNKLVNGAPGQTPHSKDAPRSLDRSRPMPTTANKKSVWTVSTKPYREAHFATFPPKLIEPCVLAGSSPRACGVCGGRSVVLDPFSGAGTTGLVALQHGRSFIGIELNPAYVEMASERIAAAERLGFRQPDKGPEPIAGQLALDGTAA
jgi:DNA modification methylase